LRQFEANYYASRQRSHVATPDPARSFNSPRHAWPDPEFRARFGELEISVVDTKGVDDVAVREDLDARLKDPRTAVIFSRFHDAPVTMAGMLLQHMSDLSEHVDAFLRLLQRAIFSKRECVRASRWNLSRLAYV
jgi:hypothetical protein